MTRNTILFDINETVLNLNLLKPKFAHAFGDESVMGLWFSTLLHTSTVCAVTGLRTGFATLAGDVLNNIAARTQVTLSKEARDDILSTFSSLSAHDDIKPALAKLRDHGYQTIAFSNSSQALIEKQINNAGLNDYFDQVLSVESTGSFKPDSKVYQFAANHLNKTINELRLVATHDWDTHGAMSAGMLAAYIDRAGTPYNPQYLTPTIHEQDMLTVVEKIIEADHK
ncbi:haloacid dehalogenase type II [Psychromonas sp. B3M02]|uniref:haloacid dehalogenase type II n=1 Tax=Psychromonas sp. B3M02 TaxID=2267226 RepID=UPI000DEB05F9|nr:haloacid dehalogenase type II [Psychromonas sp. B3M02]RBW47856.1 haloacid dehalogenase type II [Psychromonas sp. B3M02]